MTRTAKFSGIAFAAILWALPAQAYHCRPGKIWLRHGHVCVTVRHQATRHARVQRHHYARHHVRRLARLVKHHRVERPAIVEEEPIEAPPMKRGDRLTTKPRPAPVEAPETPAFVVPYELPRSIMQHQPPQWRL